MPRAGPGPVRLRARDQRRRRPRTARAARPRGPASIAGGHSLLPMMKLRLARPEWLIDINDLAELRHIRVDGDELRVGALTRHARPARVRRRRPAASRSSTTPSGSSPTPSSATAARSAARSCQADPAEDLTDGLRRRSRAAGRHPRAAAASGPSTSHEFHRGPVRDRRASSDELLTEIRFPIRPRAGSAYEKVERRVGDWAVAAAGAALWMADGRHDRRRRDRPDRPRRSRARAPTRPAVAASASGPARTCSPRPAGLAARGQRTRSRTSAARSTTSATSPTSSPGAPCAGRSTAPPTPPPSREADHAGHDDRQRRPRSPATSNPGCCSCTSCATTLGLTGTHWGCDTRNCGTCVVLVDGEPVKSCTVLAAMADGHEVRTVEGLADGGDARPGAAGLHGGARPAVRLLHPGDDAHRPRAARPRTRPGRGRDPRGHLRPDLPLHRLRTIVRSDPVGRRAPGRRRTRPRRRCRHDRRRGPSGRARGQPRARPPPTGRSASAGCSARRTRASSAARATTSTTSCCPGCCTARSCARRWRTPGSSRSTPPRRCPPEGARRHHRQGPRGPQPRLGADAVGRRPGRAGHRQGAVPGPGGRLRRRRGPVLRPRRARAHRRRVRGRCRSSSTPAGRSTPAPPVIRDDKEGQTDNHIFDWEAGDKAETDAVFAARRRRRQPGGRLPAGAPGADGDLRRGRRLRPDRRQADALRDHPGAARPPHALRDGRRHPRAQDPGHLARDIGGGFGNKVGIYPGYICAVVGSIVTGKPVKWVEDRSENLMSTSFARDYIMTGRGRGDEGRQDPRRPHARAGRPRRVQRHRAADQVPGRLLLHLHRQLRPRGRALLGHRRLHEQGARRGRLRLLVPGHRGGLPGRADGRRPRARSWRWTRPSCG